MLRQKVSIITAILVFIIFNPLLSQNWPKIFQLSSSCVSHDFFEQYDRGYVLLGQVDPGSANTHMYAWIIKTNINGSKIWEKKILSQAYDIAGNGLDQTPDGGFVVTGVTSKLDSLGYYDVVFLKFNSCGEKEWCKIFSTPNIFDYGVKIKTINDGYLALVSYFNDTLNNKRIWLFKLDLYGNAIWQKYYAHPDSIFGEDGRDLAVFPDGSYMITGDAYHLNPGQPAGWLRPLIIKTNTDGDEQWVLPFGSTSGFRGAFAHYPTLSPSGFYYASAQHSRDTIPYGDSPCFLKMNFLGDEVYYRDLIQNSIFGGSYSLNFINTYSIISSAVWNYSGTNGKYGLLLSDTNGNVTKTKELLNIELDAGSVSRITVDSKYVVSAGMMEKDSSLYQIYLFKMNHNLEFDSIYTRPFTYDSLCPHPIVSDTISLDDCAVVTSIYNPQKEPERSALHVYPNPATNNVTIELPQYLVKRNIANGITATTTYYQWNTVIFEIYNLFGKLVFTSEIPQQIQKLEVDISSWHSGMYVARVVYNKEKVAERKFMVIP